MAPIIDAHDRVGCTPKPYVISFFDFFFVHFFFSSTFGLSVWKASMGFVIPLFRQIAV
jgi:hypothetical protein